MTTTSMKGACIVMYTLVQMVHCFALPKHNNNDKNNNNANNINNDNNINEGCLYSIVHLGADGALLCTS